MSNPLVLTTTTTGFELLTTLSGQSVPALPQSLMALVQSFGATFVYRPGGVASGNVYTSWSTLYAALSALPGPKWVEVDDSIISPAPIPAGSYNLDQVTLSGLSPSSRLLFDDGATIGAATVTLLIRNLNVQSNNTGTVWTFDNATTIGALHVQSAAIVCNEAAAPFLLVTAGTVQAWSFAGTFGDGAHVVFESSGTGSLFINLFSESELAGAGVASSASLDVFYDDTTTINLPQGGGQTIIQLSQAQRVEYSPGTSADWNPVPTTVAGALDALAAPNSLQEVNAAPLTGNVCTLNSTGTLTRALSGWFVVSGVASGSDSTGENVQVTITMDSAHAVGTPVQIPTGGVGHQWGVGLTAMIQVTDTAPHHFGLVAQGLSAGTLTVGTDFAQVSVHEIP
jgi:hypothetical protein